MEAQMLRKTTGSRTIAGQAAAKAAFMPRKRYWGNVA
jgi:hypothetical protein